MNEQILTNRPLFGARLNMSHPLARGLVGYWLLNENGVRAFDCSPYQNNGVSINLNSSWQGKWFNGISSIISIPNNRTSLGAITQGLFTVIIWFKHKTISPGGNTVLFMNGDGAVDWNIQLNIPDSNKIGYSIVKAVGGQKTVLGAITLVNNENYCAAFTSDNVTLKGYLQAIKEVTTDTLSAGLRNATQELTFGAAYVNNVLESGFSNLLYNVALYKRALTEADIQFIYASPYSPMGTPLFI